jgi:hypothetical protein
LNYQRVTEQRLLNLVRVSPTKEQPKETKGMVQKIQAAGQAQNKDVKKMPGTASTASTEKGRDSRVQYKQFWKEAGLIFPNFLSCRTTFAWS